jgi:nitrogen PTS system EIIA component
MKLSSLLNPDNILIGSSVRSKEDAIIEIYRQIKKNYKFRIDTSIVKQVIQEREELGGTSFKSGIAIPHARLDDFDDLLIGILIPETPIEDEGIKLEMVVLILTSKAVSNVYLNTLASFIKLSRNTDQFKALTSVKTGEDFKALVEKENIKVKEEVTVANIMSEEVISLTPDATIRELADIFYKHKIGYVPVISESGELVGETNLVMLIKEGIPDYASQLGHLKFLKTFEPLERLFRREDDIFLKDIMKKPSVTFSRDTSVIEAALEFTTRKRRHISVVEDGKVVGIVALADILNKILRS